MENKIQGSPVEHEKPIGVVLQSGTGIVDISIKTIPLHNDQSPVMNLTNDDYKQQLIKEAMQPFTTESLLQLPTVSGPNASSNTEVPTKVAESSILVERKISDTSQRDDEQQSIVQGTLENSSNLSSEMHVTQQSQSIRNDMELDGENTSSLHVINASARSLIPLKKDHTLDKKESRIDNRSSAVSTSPPKDVIDLPPKRASPWRQPRPNSKPPPPIRTASDEDLIKLKSLSVVKNSDHIDETHQINTIMKEKKTINRKRKLKDKYRMLFRDSFQIEIPLSVTADLGVALQRSRAKRIKTIFKYFPSIERNRNNDGETSVLHENDDSKETPKPFDKEKGDLTTETSNHEGKGGNKKKPLPKLKHVPKPEDYASVIDYLEAKYVQGIMIDDEANDGANSTSEHQNDVDDDDEGGGSVYSETSFLDDSALQRTVAEQVLGHSTTTKLELMQDNDDDFFVNVGDLEVEETEMTQMNYDPLNDTDKEKLIKRKRPKKLISADDHSTSISTKESKAISSSEDKKVNKDEKKKESSSISKKSEEILKNKKKSVDDENSSVQAPKKKKIKTDENENTSNTSSGTKLKLQSNEKTNKSTSLMKIKAEESEKSIKVNIEENTLNESLKIRKKPGKKPLSEEAKALQKASRTCKKKMESYHKKVEDYVLNATEDELPRKPKTVKKLRVELKCPADKKTGDMITFTNPHVSGQKLRVKIPANRSQSGVFKVTVPIPSSSTEDKNDNIDENVDYNRISRKFYDLLEDYARSYDEWCDAEGEYRKYIGDNDFTTHFEKRKKFDSLILLFPNNELKTPVDKPYLQKILRRARQNKHKRDKTLAKLAEEKSFQSHQGLTKINSNNSSDDENDDEDNKSQTSKKIKKLPLQLSLKKKAISSTITRAIIAPQLSTIFPTYKFNVKEIL